MPEVNFQTPIGGISRILGYQNTEPFTVYDSQNLIPTDVETGRSVIATRPPIVAQTSPGATINMAAQINGFASAKPIQSMICATGSDVYWWNGTVWVAATGASASAISTTTAVHAKAFLQKVYIGNPGAVANPFVFDYAAGTVELLTESAGTCPDGLNAFSVFAGCLVASGAPGTPHVLYLTRTGNALDWDFSVGVADEGGAFFTAGENEGLINGVITGHFAHADDQLVISTLEGLSVMRGHPRRGGILGPLASGVYMLGQFAHTSTPDDVSYFMTNKGLMSLNPDPRAVPTFISRDKVPDSLIGLDYDVDNPTVNLQYDSRWNAILITVRAVVGGTSAEAWWYDLRAGGFHRMTMDFPPHVMFEFPTFVTNNKSGVLMFGEDNNGIGRMERFTEQETGTTRLLTGAVPLSESPSKAGIVQEAEFVFTGQVTAGDALIGMAGGRDAEDAVGRCRNQQYDYAVDLSVLKSNGYICRPRVAGSAFAMDIIQGSGRYALDSVLLKVKEAGRSRRPRIARIAPTVVDDTNVNFTTATWTGYVSLTVKVDTQTQTDFTHLLDLSLITDSTWWSTIRPSGADLRVTDSSNNDLPRDLISFNVSAQTGFLAFKHTSTTSTFSVRLWVGNKFAGTPGGSSAPTNSYDANYIGFWPTGAGTDRTSNSNTMVGFNGLVVGDSAGPIGSTGTGYEKALEQYATALTQVPINVPYTLQGYATNTLGDAPAGSSNYNIIGASWNDQGESLIQNALELAENVTSSEYLARANTRDTGDDFDLSAGVATAGNLYTGAFASASSRTAYINGATIAADTSTSTVASDLEIITAGRRAVPSDGSDQTASALSYYDGILSLLSLHDVARPAAWAVRSTEMLTQATFYTGISAFTTP